jgi:hypothetical protein
MEAGLMAAKRNPKKLATVMFGTLAAELAREQFNQITADQLGVPLEELDKRFSEYDQNNTAMVYLPPKVAMKLYGEEQETLSNGIQRPYALKHTIPPVIRQWMSPFKGLAQAIKKGNAAELPVNILDEFLPGTVPLKADSKNAFGESLVNRAMASLPAYARAPIEQVADKQFFTGAPIVGSRLAGLPAAEQFSETTDPLYRALGRGLNISPKRLEHLGRELPPGAVPDPVQLAQQGPWPVERRCRQSRRASSKPSGISPSSGPRSSSGFTPQRYEEELAGLPGPVLQPERVNPGGGHSSEQVQQGHGAGAQRDHDADGGCQSGGEPDGAVSQPDLGLPKAGDCR